MYKYRLSSNNEIDGELVNQPLTEVGYIDGWWLSETKLKYMLPDNSYRYQVIPVDINAVTVEHELIDNFDVELYKPALTARIKSMVTDIISSYDWKIQRHTEQKLLVTLKVLDKPALSTTAFNKILKEKQVLRDLSNLGEIMVKAITTEQGLIEAEQLFLYDFSDPLVAKGCLDEWSTNV